VVQELEFRPSGTYRQHLRELEAMFHLDQHGLDVFLEIDRRARGLGLFFEGLNERHTGLHFTLADLQRSDWTAQIKAAIDQRM
jgi:sporulation-control protein